MSLYRLFHLAKMFSFPSFLGFPKAQLKEQLAEAKAAEAGDEKIYTSHVPPPHKVM